MSVAVCRNAECSEYGTPKEMSIALGPDEVVTCGGMTADGPCGQPCDVDGSAPREPQ